LDIKDKWNNARSNEITTITKDKYELFVEMSKNLPYFRSIEWKESSNAILGYTDLEDIYTQIIDAKTHKDSTNNQCLELSSTAGADSLPFITVIVPFLNNINKISSLLLKYNINTSRYPKHRINYLYQLKDESFRLTVSKATTEYIVIMDHNMIYMPHSIYAKVKLLIDNAECSAVTSNIMCHYHISENKSYVLFNKVPTRNATAFERDFFLKYEDCCDIDEYFYNNRKSYVINMPFSYNCIQVHQDSLSDEYIEDNNKIHKSMFDDNIIQLMTKLYRLL